MTVGHGADDDTAGLPGDEPGERAAELPGGQPPPLAVDERDAFAAAVLLAEGVEPVGEGGQVVVGLLSAFGAGGVRAQVVPRSGDPREQAGVPACLQAFQDLDDPFDGFADDPGRGHADRVIFTFEGQAGEPAAVDAAVLGLAHAQAAGPQVLDYWWKTRIPSMRYSSSAVRI